MACWKQNNFVESLCSKEMGDFYSCVGKTQVRLHVEGSCYAEKWNPPPSTSTVSWSTKMTQNHIFLASFLYHHRSLRSATSSAHFGDGDWMLTYFLQRHMWNYRYWSLGVLKQNDWASWPVHQRPGHDLAVRFLQSDWCYSCPSRDFVFVPWREQMNSVFNLNMNSGRPLWTNVRLDDQTIILVRLR